MTPLRLHEQPFPLRCGREMNDAAWRSELNAAGMAVASTFPNYDDNIVHAAPVPGEAAVKAPFFLISRFDAAPVGAVAFALFP